MSMGKWRLMAIALVAAGVFGWLLGAPGRAQGADSPAGIVCNIKVLSDKCEDVSSPEDWKKTYIQDAMTDDQKALAIWKTVVKYRHQTNPPDEGICSDGNVHDPFKTIQVYGYGMCCCAACNVEGLARYLGYEARGRIISAHSVPEINYNGAWHLVDGSLMNYFRNEDGALASVDDIRKAVRGWWESHPEEAKAMRGNDGALRKFALNEGWKKGPALLATSTAYDKNGINSAGWHGWPSTMQEYDWSDSKAAVFDYGASMGYRLNIQLRPGEKITRCWSNKGLHVNMPGEAPEGLKPSGNLNLQRKMGDLAPARIGNGTHEYNVPLADGAFRLTALAAENLATSGEDKGVPVALHAKDAAKPGVLVIRMPSSYVYLSGKLATKAVVGQGGSIAVSLSDNNGLDWKPVARIEASGEQTTDLKDFVFRRYDYRLKFEINGQGTGLDLVKVTHDIQHSQAPLPIIVEGDNKIHFMAGAAEGTITLEGNMNVENGRKLKQVVYTDYHPVVNGLQEQFLRVGDSGKGDATFIVPTPGDVKRVRMNIHYRARDKVDGYDAEVSFDGGKTFKKVDRFGGPFIASSKYVTLSDVPAGVREARIRIAGNQRNTACIFNMRMDVDYQEPNGGFSPVKITYVWDEGGAEKKDEHIAMKPDETYSIKCGTGAVPKSFSVELAEARR